MEGLKTDTLPLVQKLKFSYEATTADGGYLYLNTNVFTLLGKNPFTSADRYTDIDFGHLANYSFSSVYKIPEGYKLDAIPQPINMTLPDKSLIFKRIISQEDNTVSVRYIISRRKVLFSSAVYPDVKSFYQKMYSLLNEQVVLKKS